MIVAITFAVALQAGPIVGRASVIDGDTLEIRGQRIRLWGIDAPEGRQTCIRGSETYRCGTDAANRLDRWIRDRIVSCVARGQPDRYGRIVATCRINGEDMATWMVGQGLALDYPSFSRGEYAPQQRAASSQRLGVWAGEFQMHWEWRRGRR